MSVQSAASPKHFGNRPDYASTQGANIPAICRQYADRKNSLTAKWTTRYRSLSECKLLSRGINLPLWSLRQQTSCISEVVREHFDRQSSESPRDYQSSRKLAREDLRGFRHRGRRHDTAGRSATNVPLRPSLLFVTAPLFYFCTARCRQFVSILLILTVTNLRRRKCTLLFARGTRSLAPVLH